MCIKVTTDMTVVEESPELIAGTKTRIPGQLGSAPRWVYRKTFFKGQVREAKLDLSDQLKHGFPMD